MFSAQRNFASVYRQVEVESSVAEATPHQLVAMLFEGALAAIGRARVAMQRRDVPAKGAAIGQALRIVGEGLSGALDVRAGDVARNLREVYDYVGRRLLEANLKNDVAALDECTRLLAQVQSAWLSIAPEQRQVPRHVLAA